MRFLRPLHRVFVLCLTAVLLGAVFFLANPASSRAAFGISPPFLNTDYLIPGVTYQQTIYLVQDQPNTDLGIHADLAIDQSIRNWITIDKGFDFVIPAGTRQFPVVVSVKVPNGASLGKYSGNITFTTIPATTGGQVAIALGANLAINLTVGNNVYESYKIIPVNFPDIEEGWNPRATFRFENGGNIPEILDSATFDLYDRFGSVRLAYMTKQDGFPTVPPFAAKEYTIEFPTDFHLGVGDYWGNVTYYKNNRVIVSDRAIFHVLPTGSLSPWSKAIAFIKNNLIYLAAALALVILASWRSVAAVRRRRRRKYER